MNNLPPLRLQRRFTFHKIHISRSFKNSSEQLVIGVFKRIDKSKCLSTCHDQRRRRSSGVKYRRRILPWLAMRPTGSRDISIIWTSFLMKVVGLWLAADRYEQRRRDFALIYTVGALFIIVCIGFRDIYFTWGNFSVSFFSFFSDKKYQ